MEKNPRKKQSQPVPASEFGKLPPQATDIEEVVLGALMIESSAYSLVSEILKPDCFYKIAHQCIYEAIVSLKDQNSPVDMHTVTEQLRRNGTIDEVGGPYYITLLTAKVSSAAHLEYHSLILKSKAMARNLIAMSSVIQQMAYDDSVDVSELIEYTEKAFTEIISDSFGVEASNMEDAITDTSNHIADIQRKRMLGEPTGVPTGLKRLDDALNGGWQAPDLVILGGRPSMGKTQFAVHFAKNATQSGNETLFISIEMTKIQLLIRMLTEDDSISFYNLKTGQLSNEEWSLIDRKFAELQKLNLFIADKPNIRNLSAIKSLARSRHRKGNLKLLVIDYLQLIRTNQKFGTRDLEIGYITSELKTLAKELNIPIILLAQLNRPPKGTKIQLPQLSDLRESGNIEQDADVVIFPHRTVYYDPTAEDNMGNSLKNKGGLIIAKHREGVKDETIMFYHDDRFKKIWGDEIEVSLSRPIQEYQNKNFYDTDNENNPF